MQQKKATTILEKLLYFINCLVSFALLLSYILPFISPEKAPRIAILSLFFPFIFGLNLLFLLYWLFKRNERILLSLIVFIVGFTHFNSLYKLKEKQIIVADDLKVMSYNVKMLNYYKWSKENSIPLKILTFIKNKNPDILLLQEYYEDKNIDFKYPYQFTKMKSKSAKFGLAVFSKHPIINSGSLDFKESANNIIFTDILINKDTIRLYNVHLESVKVNPNKENFGKKNSEKLLQRFATTFKKQANQVEIFKEHQKLWKGKSIIAGDFNNTAFSWVYHKIKEEKNDAFEEAGKGFGKTFDYTFPLRIDFILCDSSFNINQFQTFNVKYSDHFPVLARIHFNN